MELIIRNSKGQVQKVDSREFFALHYPWLPIKPKKKKPKPNPRRKVRLKLLKSRPYCHYCGRKVDESSSSLDHVIPRSKGGPNSQDNLVLSCLSCNNKKADKLPDQLPDGFFERNAQQKYLRKHKSCC